MVYSPLDALEALPGRIPTARWSSSRLGFETTMPSTALTVLQAEREGVENFSLFCNHITIIPTIKAILDSPDLQLDGFLGPGHVSMVIGTTPYEFIAEHYSKPMVIAGFEPLDILQSIWMVLKQIAEGRREVENQYQRVVPDGGNTRRLTAIGEVFELREFFEWRGLGSIDHSGVRVRERVRALRRRAQVLGARPQDRRSQVVPVRRGAEGRDQALGCKVFGTRLHSGDAAGRAHGFVGRRVRGLLQYGRRPRRIRGSAPSKARWHEP